MSNRLRRRSECQSYYNEKKKTTRDAIDKKVTSESWIPKVGDMIYVGSHQTNSGGVLGGLAEVQSIRSTDEDQFVVVGGRPEFEYPWSVLKLRQVGLAWEFGKSHAKPAIPLSAEYFDECRDSSRLVW